MGKRYRMREISSDIRRSVCVYLTFSPSQHVTTPIARMHSYTIYVNRGEKIAD